MVVGQMTPKAFERDSQFDGASQPLGHRRQRLDMEDSLLGLDNNDRCILGVYILRFRHFGLESKV